MSYGRMKFFFPNFIHPLPLVEKSDDQVQDVSGKHIPASTRWCFSFILRIDISNAQSANGPLNAFASRRAFGNEVDDVIGPLLTIPG